MHRFAFLLGSIFAFASAFCSGPVEAQTPTTTITNGNDEVRLQLNYDGGFYVPGKFSPSTPADSIPATGGGTRMMWYPAKAAFRAGRVDGSIRWAARNIGVHSVAFGFDTQASGEASMALGYQAKASGSHSIAAGEGTTASGANSTAVGYTSEASGEAAFAMGEYSEATDENSVAMGRSSEASGFAAIALGNGPSASALGSAAIGSGAIASNLNSVALGFEAEAAGYSAVATGSETSATGSAATATGELTVAASDNSFSAGICNNSNTSSDGTLLVVGNGSGSNDGTGSDNCDSRSDALVLHGKGNVTIAGDLTQNSDRRLKTDIEPLGEGSLESLLSIDPVRFRFENQRSHPSGKQIGLIAQEVQKEFPELVSKGPDGMLSVAYPKFSAVLLKGLHEQQYTIDSLEVRIQRLEESQKDIDELRERLARLENRGDESIAGIGDTGTWVAFLLSGLLGAGLLWRRRG
jgi:hypothetical protein